MALEARPKNCYAPVMAGAKRHSFSEAYHDALYAVMLEDIEAALKVPEIRKALKDFNQKLLAFLLRQQGVEPKA